MKFGSRNGAYGFSTLLLLSLFVVAVAMARSTTTTQSIPLYKDPRAQIEDRVSDLLSGMTLQEKIGQMSQIDQSLASLHVLQNYFIECKCVSVLLWKIVGRVASSQRGWRETESRRSAESFAEEQNNLQRRVGEGSVVDGGASTPSPDKTPANWADMIDGFQRSAMSTRLEIPIIYGTDAVHGHNNVYGATIFPHNIGLGATRDENLMVRIGKATALEVRATGVPYTFAPSVSVCRDPRWGRCYESYSEDTELVMKMSKIIMGLQGLPPHNYTFGYPFVATGGSRNVMACAKHYAGDGGTEGGVNEFNTVATYPEFFNIHIRPYLGALAMGVSTVMASLSSWNGVKMHTNQLLLTSVLKEQLGFQGFIITDWEGIDKIATPPGSDYKNSVRAAINAGIDMVMIPYNYSRFIADLTELVLSKEVPMDRIDDAVRRILRVKFVSGIFEHPMADRSLLGMVGDEKHREVAREAVRKSLVLLKNDKYLLPLDRKAPKILVVGTHANNIGYQCGGWTISGDGSSGNITIGTTILEGIKSRVSKHTQVVFEEKPDQQFMENNGDFSYAIAVVGELPYVETNGDNKELVLPIDGVETIKNVCGKMKCLVIVVSGRPVVIEPYVEMMDALVAAWLPGSEAGKGIADVIFGDFDFHGKLPRTWFRRVDQLPMNWGDSHYDPLYSFGFGLKMNLSRITSS